MFTTVKKAVLFVPQVILATIFLPVVLFLSIVSPFALLRRLKTGHLFRNITAGFFAKKILSLILLFAVVIPLWVGGATFVVLFAKSELNLITDQVAIAGTGSMYPTFPKGVGKTIEEQTQEIVGTPGMMRYPSGFSAYGKSFFSYNLTHGDIVSFFNDKTREISLRDSDHAAGFVKRIIGLPGDVIEIRDGILYRNSEPLKEQYTARARSTFGGSFLPECKQVTVPQNAVFVLGDNRKGSADSRSDLGFVNTADIDHVIPFEKQVGSLDHSWRDITNDLEKSAKIQLQVNEYIALLNEKRTEANAPRIKRVTKLDESARLRALNILKFNDFSFEATASGYTMRRAMTDAGYSNIAYGEAPTQGYYEAEELLENQFAFPESKEFLLDSDYTEIGIAAVEGQINGCPTQVIVQHVAGYIPPNYTKDDIDSWVQALNQLRGIQPGWQSLREYPDFYNNNKVDVDRINEIIQTRIENVSRIVNRMQNNEWLTAEEQEYSKRDVQLSAEQDQIASRLNNQQ